jgi:hypothetical protein
MRRKIRFGEPLTFSEKISNFFAKIVVGLIFPFYWFWRFLVFIKENFLYEHIRTGDNGVFGPGYHVYYTSRFAWGRLTFIIVIVFIILFLIFWR